MMDIVFLGTTAAIPTTKRNHIGMALKYHKEVLLWDCGEGIQRQLIKSQTSYMKIKKVFITHFHGDHFLGLPGLIQTMSFFDKREPLHVFGPRGVKEVVKTILDLGEYEIGFDIIPKVIKHDFKLKEDMYVIRGVKVEHSIPTFGLIFEERKGREFLIEKAMKLGLKPGPTYSRLQRGEEVRLGDKVISPEDVLGERKKGIKVVYSSDTRPSENIRRECKDATLIHDATFDDSKKDKAIETKHSTCVEAGEVARDGNAKSLYLIHISPRYKKDELYEQAQKVFKNVVLTKDLMKVTL